MQTPIARAVSDFSLLITSLTIHAADLSGHKLLVTSVRTGDTEVFIADLTTGDLFNVSRSLKSEDRYPCWSPDGKQICFMSDRESTNAELPGVPARGSIGLQHEHGRIQFRNVFVRESKP